jgi:hypothetical protein
MSHFGEPAKEAVCDVLLPLVQIGHFDRYIGGEPLVRGLGKKGATTRKRSEDRKKAIFWGYYNGREKDMRLCVLIMRRGGYEAGGDDMRRGGHEGK